MSLGYQKYVRSSLGDSDLLLHNCEFRNSIFFQLIILFRYNYFTKFLSSCFCSKHLPISEKQWSNLFDKNKRLESSVCLHQPRVRAPPIPPLDGAAEVEKLAGDVHQFGIRVLAEHVFYAKLQIVSKDVMKTFSMLHQVVTKQTAMFLGPNFFVCEQKISFSEPTLNYQFFDFILVFIWHSHPAKYGNHTGVPRSNRYKRRYYATIYHW